VYVAFSFNCTGCSTHHFLQIIAFLVGFAQQDIKLALYIGLAGTALTFLVVVPPWPFYNKNPEDWLPAHNAPASRYNIDVDGQKVG